MRNSRLGNAASKGSFINTAAKEKIGKVGFIAAAAISALAVIGIFAFILIQAFPTIRQVGFFKVLFGTKWAPDRDDALIGAVNGVYGILPMVVGTLSATVGAVIVGGFLGYFTAVYLACFSNKKVAAVLSRLINLLAGIPSVIYGFFGMKVILPALGIYSDNGDGSGLLATWLILGIMILPTIVAVTKTSIESVPQSYYNGARALGANDEQAVFKIVVPSAKSGILAAFVLGVGRALGETMAVVMIAGNSPVFPSGLFSSFRTLTANVVMEMGYAGDLQKSALLFSGVILLIFVALSDLALGIIGSSKRSGTIRLCAFSFKGKGIFDKIGKYVGMVCAVISSAFLIFITGFVLIKGVPYISAKFLFSPYEYGGAISIMPSIVSTLLLAAATLIVAVPLGIATAIYLNEYAKKGRFVKIIRSAIDILSGVPSIVYGLFGMILFSNILGLGTSLIAGALTVAVMVLPTVVKSTEESLKAVPDGFREGSLALGAGKMRTIFKVVLPAALPGILQAVILSLGRAISESAPLMFTFGASIQPLASNPLTGSGTTLAVALYKLAVEGHYVNESYAAAAVLMILVFLLNIISELSVNAIRRKQSGTPLKVKKTKKIKEESNDKITNQQTVEGKNNVG